MYRVFKTLLLLIFLFVSSAFADGLSSKVNKLIQQNDKWSLYEAAEAYRYGHGAKQDIVEAARLYLRAGEKGNFHAHYDIYTLWDDFEEQYVEPPFSVRQFTISKNIAILNYERLLAKKPNDPELHYRLAILYDPGVGITGKEQNICKMHLKKAARLGHIEAKRLQTQAKEYGF